MRCEYSEGKGEWPEMVWVGRVDSSEKVRGKWVHPELLQSRISNCPIVSAVVVSCERADTGRGEMGKVLASSCPTVV